MKLKVTREGGFIPQTIMKQVDAKELPLKMQELMTAFTKQHVAGHPKINKLMRDGYPYTLEWSGEENGEIKFDDTTIPEGLHDVLTFLLK